MSDHFVSIRGTAQADHKLVLLVQAAGPDSDEFRWLKQELRDSIIGTCTELDRKGRLFREIKIQTGIGLRLCPRPLWLVHSKTLFVLAAYAAVDRFMQEHVLEGGWSPEGGASLRSYCVRLGLYFFANEYKAFVRAECDSSAIPEADLTDEDDNSQDDHAGSVRTVGPEATAVQRDTLGRLLKGAGPGVSGMLFLSAEGWTQAEIGRRLGMSEEAVSSALRRFRKTLNENRDD